MKAKRLLSLFLVTLLIVSMGAMSAGAAAADTAPTYYTALVDAKVFTDSYDAKAPITRVAFADMLVNALALTATSGKTFPDAPEGKVEVLDKVATAGLLLGTGGGKFSPDAPMLDGQLFAVVERLVAQDSTFRPSPTAISHLIANFKNKSTLDSALRVTYEAYKHKTNPQPMPTKMVVGYYGNWQAYAGCSSATLPWDRITNLNHAFLTVSDATPSDDWFGWAPTEKFQVAFTDSWADIWQDAGAGAATETQIGGHFRVYELMHKIYPNVKITMSVGGWTRGQMFSQMAATPETRKIFIDSMIAMLKQLPWIGGVDLDWEYPGAPEETPLTAIDDIVDFGRNYGSKDVTLDKANFNALLGELRAAMDAAGYTDMPLSICESANYTATSARQDLDTVAKYVDFVNVMTYDMTGSFDATTGHHAALKKNAYSAFSAEGAIEGYLKHFKPEQLNIGVATYSRSWGNVVPDANGNVLGVTAGTATPAADTKHPDASKDSRYVRGNGDSGTGVYGPDAENKHKQTDFPEVIGKFYGLYPGGMWTSVELNKFAKDPAYRIMWDDASKAPYMYNAEKKIFISYENERSIAEKGKFVTENKLGGIIFWETAQDDFTNNYPLTTSIYNSLK